MSATAVSASNAERRTYRYLRLTLVGIVIVIVSGVVIESLRSGVWLPSISHYFYSPAQWVFVGSLVAASVALLALSGTDAESTFLDIAAPFAPLIAIIPVAVDPATVERIAPALTFPCRSDSPGFPPEKCIPLEVIPTVLTSVSVYLFALLLILIGALVLWIKKQFDGRWVWVSMLVTLAVLLIVGGMLAWALFNPDAADPWLLGMHFPATAAFFISFAAVPFLNARRRTTDQEPERWQKVIYIAVVVILAIAIPGTVLAGILLGDTYWVLAGEAISLLAFGTFWLVQTIQRWNETPGSTRRAPKLEW